MSIAAKTVSDRHQIATYRTEQSRLHARRRCSCPGTVRVTFTWRSGTGGL